MLLFWFSNIKIDIDQRNLCFHERLLVLRTNKLTHGLSSSSSTLLVLHRFNCILTSKFVFQAPHRLREDQAWRGGLVQPLCDSQVSGRDDHRAEHLPGLHSLPGDLPPVMEDAPQQSVEPGQQKLFLLSSWSFLHDVMHDSSYLISFSNKLTKFIHVIAVFFTVDCENLSQKKKPWSKVLQTIFHTMLNVWHWTWKWKVVYHYIILL